MLIDTVFICRVLYRHGGNVKPFATHYYMPKELDKLSKKIDDAKYRIKEAKCELYRLNKFFGQQFRSEREKRGLSLSYVAENMGYSKAFVSDVELGRRAPNVSMMIFFTGR